MKKLMISLAALAAIGAAVPAAAQSWGYGSHDRYDNGYGSGYGSGAGYSYGGDRERGADNWREFVQHRLQVTYSISRAQDRGVISDRDAEVLRSEMSRVQIQSMRYRQHGLPDDRAAEFNARLEQIAAQLNDARRAPAYGYGDGHYYQPYGSYYGE